eukprot:g504.t1
MTKVQLDLTIDGKRLQQERKAILVNWETFAFLTATIRMPSFLERIKSSCRIEAAFMMFTPFLQSFGFLHKPCKLILLPQVVHLQISEENTSLNNYLESLKTKTNPSNFVVWSGVGALSPGDRQRTVPLQRPLHPENSSYRWCRPFLILFFLLLACFIGKASTCKSP